MLLETPSAFTYDRNCIRKISRGLYNAKNHLDLRN